MLYESETIGCGFFTSIVCASKWEALSRNKIAIFIKKMPMHSKGEGMACKNTF